MRGRVIPIPVVLAAVLAWPSPAAGQSETISCSSGNALIGLDGWQGWWMDGVRGVCAGVNVAQGTNTSSRQTTRVAGTAKGTTLTARCGTNEVVTGFTGSRGTYVLTIHSIRCSDVLPGGYAASGGRWVNAFPKKSGGTFLAKDCISGMVATGMTVRHGVYLDYFTLACTHLPGATQQVASSTPTAPLPSRTIGTVDPRAVPGAVTLASPADNVQINGYQGSEPCADSDPIPPFDWSDAANAASYQLELRNLTAGRVRTSTTTASRLTLVNMRLIAGHQYSWRVRGRNALGFYGSWSAARRISAVAGPAPSGTGGCLVVPTAIINF